MFYQLALSLALCLALSGSAGDDQTEGNLGFILPVDAAEYHDIDRFAWWKITAKGKLDAQDTLAARRAIERRHALRDVVKARLAEFQEARGTLDFLLESSLRLLEAELATANSPAEKAAAHGRHWELTEHVEWTVELHSNHGRFTRNDLAEARFYRLEAEQRLFAASKELGPRTPSPWVPLDLSADSRAMKNMAKARLAAMSADPTALVQAKLSEAAIECAAREDQFLVGRGTLDFLLDSFQRVYQAERELAQSEDEKRSALEKYWQRCLCTESVNQERYDAGRVGIRDLFRPRYWRTNAERQLALEKDVKKDSRIPAGPLNGERFLSAKTLAQAKWRLVHSTALDAARQKRNAAAIIAHTGTLEFLNGRGTLEFVLESYRMLRQAITDVDPSPQARAAAAAQIWELLKLDEVINKERYLSGRITLHDYLETLSELLAADPR